MFCRKEGEKGIIISWQEYEAFFGTENLIRYDETAIHSLSIPDDSKRFLIDVGLPKKYYPASGISYRPLLDVPLLDVTFGADYSLPQASLGFRVFCTAHFEDIGSGEVLNFYCLDEQTNGRIMRVDRSFGVTWSIRFLNSSIPQFSEFLLTIHQFDQWLRQRYDEQERSVRPFRSSEVELRSRLIMRRLRRIDSEMFAELGRDADGYNSWENVIETMAIHCGSSL